MGQQQLLLLVLATVIVGLATVAGIQAFDENRQQAAADALQSKALNVVTDIKGLDQKPKQLGGLPSELNTSGVSASIGTALGFESNGSGGSTTYYAPVTGAGTASSETPSTANCQIDNTSKNQVTVKCTGRGNFSSLTYYGVYDQDAATGNQVSVQISDPNA